MGASALLMTLLLFAITAYSSDTWPASAPAEQLHIAFGSTPDTMTLSWATKGNTSTLLDARWRIFGSAGAWNVAPGDNRVVGGYTKHRTVATSLVPGTRYEYEVEGSDGSYATSSFKAQRNDTGWSPRIVMFGDLGWTNDQLLPYLGDEAAAGTIDAIVIFGDMVYWDNGENENSFMRDVSLLSGTGSVPLHVSPGNGDAGANFSRYRHDFYMPGADAADSLWHSFNLGHAHVVGISTEAFYYQDAATQANMMAWLEADLREANTAANRVERPWLVVHYHRPAYSTNYGGSGGLDGDAVARDKFEPVLYKYGVDLVFAGHVHNQERSWPVLNGTVLNGTSRPGNPYHMARAPVHIVSGNPSNAEGASVREIGLQPWTAWRSLAYGYSHLDVVNASHLHVDIVSTNLGGAVVDEFWLSKDKPCAFGPECVAAAANAPAGEQQQKPLNPRPEAVALSRRWNRQRQTEQAPAPADQVAALWHLYQHLGGDTWAHNSGWSPHGDPCAGEQPWFGVSCVAMTDQTINTTAAAASGSGSGTTVGVTALQLPMNNLRGNVTDLLSSDGFAALMRTLQLLDLSDNWLTGTLLPTAALWRGPQLHSLYLDARGSGDQVHRLRGQMPADIGTTLPNLRHLSLQQQRLSGSIPASFGQLPCRAKSTQGYGGNASACVFWLQGNELDGQVPAEICGGDHERTTWNEMYLKGNMLQCPYPCLPLAYGLTSCPGTKCSKC